MHNKNGLRESTEDRKKAGVSCILAYQENRHLTLSIASLLYTFLGKLTQVSFK